MACAWALPTLAEFSEQGRAKTAARLQLDRWLFFNVLVGNGDNYLKNVSFLVSEQGIRVAPAYDRVWHCRLCN